MSTSISANSHGSNVASSEDVLRLGLRIKYARLAKGMRLADLAKVSNCSESLISKIENNKATPSLNTLHRLAKGLGMTIATLLGDHVASQGIVMRKGQRPILSRLSLNGTGVDGVETELLIPFGAESVLQATLFRVQPGARSDGMRQHEGDEVGYVLSGDIALTVDGDTYSLQAGDAFFFSSTRPHEVTNPGNTVAEIVWVNTPPTL